jgi:hypothetical protein
MTESFHAWFNTILSSIGVVGMLGLAYQLGRYTERVNTMWQSFLTRSVAEGVKRGMLEVHSPVRLVNDSGNALQSMAEELRALHQANPKLSETDLSLLIQKNFGARLLHDVCLPNDIPYGVCLVIATSVAKGEQPLTEILDEYVSKDENKD